MPLIRWLVRGKHQQLFGLFKYLLKNSDMHLSKVYNGLFIAETMIRIGKPTLWIFIKPYALGRVVLSIFNLILEKVSSLSKMHLLFHFSKKTLVAFLNSFNGF